MRRQSLNLILFFTCLALVLAKNEPSEHTNALHILDSLLRNYDRRATPTNHLGVATEVECKLYVRSLGSINPDTMDYQVDLYLRQHWSDTRLNHPELMDPLDLNDPNLVKAIWKPEVYFPNAKDAEFQYVTVPNVLVRIDPGGQILYMLRLKLKFSCMMELSNFPLDEQVCTMEIASFSKTTKELILRWKEPTERSVDISGEVKMPQFEIFKIVPNKCQETFHIGNYSCLLAELHLKRSLGFHMVQSYLPTILIVVISWVSFWMDVDSVAGRTTLGVTTLLTVSSKASDVQAEVPLVSYVKAIDIWMGACTGFIFAALLEFTFTNYLWRKGQKYRLTREQREAKKGGFGPVAAAATAAVSGFDPTMFTQMMAAGAVAGNATVEESHLASNRRSLFDKENEMADDQIPLTSPAHDLLKQRRSQFPKKLKSFEMQPATSMRRAFSMDNYASLETASSMPPMNNTNNGHSHSYVDTEVCDFGKSVDTRVVTFDTPPSCNGGVTSHGEAPQQGASDCSRSNSISGDLGTKYCRRAIRIDELSRAGFPLAFLIFNVLYWTYYTQWAK